MSERNLIFLLEDIQQSILEIKLFVKDYTFETYLFDLKTRYAVERNFTVIGEAASRVDKDFQNINNQIKWRDLKDFRNFVVHEYFGVDNNIVWNIIQVDLTALLTEISILLAKEKNNF